jgi:hypothetical protein
MIDFLEIEDTKTVDPGKPHLLAAFAAAALVIAGLATILNQDSLFVNPASPESVAESFMDAWVRGDGEAAAALFSPDGRFYFYESGILPALSDWFQVMGQNFHSEGCTVRSGRVVDCAYTFDNKLTRQTDDVPRVGAFALVIGERGIDVVSNSAYLPKSSLRPRMLLYAPPHFLDFGDSFIWWLQTEHPDDASRIGADFFPVANPGSIELWERYTDEYLDATGPTKDFVIEARSICRASSERFESAIADIVGRSWTLELEAAWSDAAADYAEESLGALRSLATPDSERDRFNELLALMERQSDVLRQIENAASGGDNELVGSLMDESVDLTHRKDDLGGPDFWECPINLPG